MKKVVIIGNGIAGITAARHIRKRSNCAISVISSESPYFFSRTALMYVYMGHLKFEHTKPYEDHFWKKNRIDLIFDHAESLNTENKHIVLKSGRTISYDQLIIATGSRSNRLNVPGVELDGVQTLYSCDDLDQMTRNTLDVRSAVVIGGGLIGVEMAEMLRSRNIHTEMIIREKAYWNNVLPLQESKMISRHIESHDVTLHLEDELAEITGDSNGRVTGIRTLHGKSISCQFVGLAVGVRPNVSWLEGSAVKVNEGVVVNEFLETNIPDVYAIGDCAERLHAIDGRKSIEQVWYTARMMGETVAETLCGQRTAYRPGPWFNSAKFFDIEYQTYGTVRNLPADDEDEYYWEHPGGDKAVHFLWKRQTRELAGVNAFGLRMRHEKFDRWLRSGATIDHVIDHLAEANFDPEFSKRYEAAIREQFQRQATMVS